jgi:hypothetical protein
MWVPGCTVYVIAALLLGVRALQPGAARGLATELRSGTAAVNR